MTFTEYISNLKLAPLTTYVLLPLGFILSSQTVQAAFSDIDPSFTSAPYTCPANPNDAADPANHKMYAVAVNYRPYAPQSSQKLIWAAGTESKSFTFDSNKNLTISFTDLVDEVNADTNPFFGSGTGSGPSDGFYDRGNENTVDAINVRHVNNSEGQKHVLNLSVDRNVSKIGYKIQDVDSRRTGNFTTNYRQQVDISDTGGTFFATSINSTLQDTNGNRSIVSGKDGSRCSLGQCVLDASWNYTTADDQVRLKHNNIDSSGASLYFNYLVGYSDFYFCLAPPKVIVKKSLNGIRVNDEDQFRIELRQSSDNSEVAAFTTTGTDSVVTDNTTTVTTLRDGFNYTISQKVIGGSLFDYDTTYSCANETTGTSVAFSSGQMSLNTDRTLRTFNLNNVSYGDEITCTVTNTPTTYTFSGTVFNDDGGITTANADNANLITGSYANNDNYFNGIFDNTAPNTESVITDTNSTVDLTDCSATVIASQPVAANGKYSINASASQLTNNTNLCLVEKRNTGVTTFPIRTSPASKSINFQISTYNYPDNNFGRVIADNAALVLQKYQFVNDCDAATLDYPSVPMTDDPRTGFSMDRIQGNITPQQCIAYKIVATNRSNLKIDDFVMSDTLQKKGVDNAQATSIRVAPTDANGSFATDSVAIGANGTVKTTKLILPQKTKREFYFNTRYKDTVYKGAVSPQQPLLTTNTNAKNLLIIKALPTKDGAFTIQLSKSAIHLIYSELAQ